MGIFSDSCPTCGGNGYSHGGTCPECKGKGRVAKRTKTVCDKCDGSGTVYVRGDIDWVSDSGGVFYKDSTEEKCPKCNGRGKY